jgi:hypothetical protein
MYHFMHQILLFTMKLQFCNPNTVRALKCARVFTIPFFFLSFSLFPPKIPSEMIGKPTPAHAHSYVDEKAQMAALALAFLPQSHKIHYFTTNLCSLSLVVFVSYYSTTYAMSHSNFPLCKQRGNKCSEFCVWGVAIG